MKFSGILALPLLQSWCYLHSRCRLVQGFHHTAGDYGANSADPYRYSARACSLRRFFTATSMIGFIALAGIIVRNSII
jgi:hypothetical protein